jgi:hypothetical protein
MEYRNGSASLSDIVGAFCEVHDTATEEFSTEQLHDLSDIITQARHDRHGQPPSGTTRQTIVITDRNGTERYRQEELTPAPSTQGEQ